MRSGWGSDEGTVTAEFALLLPVIVSVLVLAIGALSLVNMQIGNSVFVGEWSRAVARKAETTTVIQRMQNLKPAARLNVVEGEGVMCLKLSEPVNIPLWSFLIPRLEVSSCVPAP